MKTGTIRQTVGIRAPPSAVYAALMTTRGHRAFTGAPARIGRRVGDAFVAWGGYIHGKNLELRASKTIVQSWRPTDKAWPPRYFSQVRLDLEKTAAGTRIRFAHSGVPVEHLGHLSVGWKKSYWIPLQRYLEPRHP